MADLAGDPYGHDHHGAHGWRRQAALALGAVAALALVWGLVSWGHGLLTRDVGAIPFIRAEGGPFKEVPDDPGGLKLEGADLAVSRMVGDATQSGDATGDAALAPPPESLSDEDQPQPYLERESAMEAAAEETLGAQGEGESVIDDAVARAIAQEDLAQAEEEESAATAAETSLTAAPAAPLPPSRPASAPARSALIAPAAAAAQIQAASAAQLQAAGPATLAAGDIAIQLGAFNSEAIAQSQWRRHLRENEDLLSSFGHAVTTVESGGRTLFRLRAGPIADRSKAQELCAALRARGDACIVATVR